jgi:hypothetical protein
MFPLFLMFISFLGFMIIVGSHGNGVLHYWYFDVLGGFIMLMPVILMFYRLRIGDCWNEFDLPKKNKPLFDFLYRVGVIRSIFGKRLPGTGYSSIKTLGLVQEVGRLPAPGSVYRKGDKLKQFVLQDLAHTPNPKFTGFCTWLTEIGFNNITEVYRVLNGYDADLMVKVWDRLNDGKDKSSTDILVERLQNLTPEDRAKYPKKFKVAKESKDETDAHAFLDKLPKVRVGRKNNE